MSAPTWGALDRARVEVGKLLDRHDRGTSPEELRRYRGRFTAFAEELFGIELTPQQTEGARALERGDRQILVRGGNGVGKDTLTALWALHEVYCREALALVSGPTDRQVREVLMRREIGRLWRLSGGKLPGERYEMALRIPGREEGGLLAFTASDPERFVGHHSALGRVFVGLTEAQGIPGEIFEAAQRCQPTTLLAVCNPTSPATAVHGFSRSAAWTSLRWSCLDHPNVTSGEVRIPGAVTREWVEAMRQEHGEGSRFWTVAVLAEFPEEAESPLFRALRWEQAVQRGEDLARAMPELPPYVTLGVDVSRGGDDRTAVVVRRGPVLWDLHCWREPDTQVNAERLAHLCRGLLEEERVGVEAVVIDEVGDGGGVFDKFRRLARGLTWHAVAGADAYCPRLVRRTVRALGFKGSRGAGMPERFANLRAQAFHHVGVEFEEERATVRPGIDPDLLSDLREELLVHQRIHQADDRILIAPKDELRKVLGRSPDLADALSMSYLPDLQESGAREIWFR